MVHDQSYHVVYIITKLELGGAQKVCLALVDGLTELGIGVTLISGTEGVLVDQVQRYKSVILLDSLTRDVSIWSWWREIRVLYDLIVQLRCLKKKYATLIVHTHSTKAGVLGRLAAFFARIPIVVHTIHGFGFHKQQGYIRWLFTYAIEYAMQYITTHTIFVANADQDFAKRYLRCSLKRSSVIRAAVDYQAFCTPVLRMQESKNTIVIGSVACFKPQKNNIDLFKAVQRAQALVPDITIRLELVGDGQLRNTYEQWIIEQGMQEAIALVGWQHNVAEWMARWDIFALSSLWEGLPCAVVEARLKRLPVVAYAVGGIAEVIQSACNGFLCTPGDWHTQGTYLALLCRYPGMRAQISNYVDNLEAFKNETMIEQHRLLYTILQHNQKASL